MKMTWHCYTHDLDIPGRIECPECRADEAARLRRKSLEQLEQQEEARWRAEMQAEKQHDEDLYRRANPGEYECPHCRYISLKRDASRCPLCHGTVDTKYWSLARERETEAAKKKLAASQAALESARVAAAESVRKAAESRRKEVQRSAAPLRAFSARLKEAEDERRRNPKEPTSSIAIMLAIIGAIPGLLGFGGILGAIIGAVIGAIAGFIIGDARD